jgi:hypothetical protein
MTLRKRVLTLMLALLMFAMPILVNAQTTDPAVGPTMPPPMFQNGGDDNTTTYLYFVNGYVIAMSPLAYFIITWGYDVCQALLWC